MIMRFMVSLVLVICITGISFGQDPSGSDPSGDEALQDSIGSEGVPNIPQEQLTDPRSLGSGMVEQLWADISSGNSASLEACACDGFQAMTHQGMLDVSSEVSRLVSLDLGDYVISDVNVTMNGPVLVTTYTVTKRHTVVGEVVSSDPASMLSAWERIDGEWKWLIQADIGNL